MLVNLFHGYSHLVNGVVFSCNMFPGHLIGRTVAAISYSEWLFDRINAITIFKSLQSKGFLLVNVMIASV